MFAAARPAVAHVLRQMFSKPKNGGDYLRLVGRYGPELAFPAINAFMLPEDASAGDRLGAFGEALALNTLGSTGGEFLGGLAGQRLARSRRWSMKSPQALESINTGLGLGGTIGGIAGNFVPMPFTNGIYERAMLREQERQQAQQSLESANLYTGLGGLGAIAASPLFDSRLMM